jgi:hypothetical protein
MFLKTDFEGDTKMKICVIVMHLIGKPPLTRFNQLLMKEKRLFNEKLNEFIENLPNEWEEKLQNEFHQICNDEIFNENFNAEKYLVLGKVDT